MVHNVSTIRHFGGFKMKAILNARGIIDYFGGARSLQVRMARANIAGMPTAKALDKMRQRNSMSGERLAQVIATALIDNIPFDVTKFVFLEEDRQGPRQSAVNVINPLDLLD
jgi:hypothetical protein